MVHLNHISVRAARLFCLIIIFNVCDLDPFLSKLNASGSPFFRRECRRRYCLAD